MPEKGVVECWVISYIGDQAESFSYKNRIAGLGEEKILYSETSSYK